MGQDKTELAWGQTSLLSHVAGQMFSLFDDIIIVSGNKLKEIPGARCVQDIASGTEGPMAGLLTGLAEMNHDWAFAVAADMPFIEPETVRFLWSLTGREYQAVIPFVCGHEQTLAACYHRKAFRNGRALWDQGQRSLKAWTASLTVRWVREWEWRQVDPNLKMLANLNTPEEYALARAHG
jgi:molybdopterin-guanine dinucleotide biosynthesis protein A